MAEFVGRVKKVAVSTVTEKEEGIVTAVGEECRIALVAETALPHDLAQALRPLVERRAKIQIDLEQPDLFMGGNRGGERQGESPAPEEEDDS